MEEVEVYYGVDIMRRLLFPCLYLYFITPKVRRGPFSLVPTVDERCHRVSPVLSFAAVGRGHVVDLVSGWNGVNR